MSFTDSERSKIRGYLGYPDLHYSSNPRLEGALDVAGSNSEIVTIVQGLLTKLAAIETAIDTSSIDTAGISSVGEGDPEFYRGQAISDLRRIGRGLCSKLSIKLGVTIVADYFGETGHGGDGFLSHSFQFGGIFH